VQLRAAAREAVAAIGAPAWGHYKDAYKNLMGDNPPRGWDWERTVRELFRLHDRARLTQVYELWEQGQNAANDKRWEEATDAYDKVLARAPMFDERHQMATAYRERATVLIDEGKDDVALVMLRKALRLSAKDADTNKIASRLAMLEGKALLAAGTPDRHILQRALDLDPDNVQAKQLLASLEEEAEERRSESWRYIAAAAIGVVALVLMLLLWRRPRRKAPEGEVSA
jgi:tetratricopeptide (TPR) repeat protein